jgi:hypothetical protein
MNMNKITPAQAAGLVGESLSLPVIGRFMQAIYMHNQNPWWDRKGKALVQDFEEAKDQATKDVKTRAQEVADSNACMKKKRRTGAA